MAYYKIYIFLILIICCLNYTLTFNLSLLICLINVFILYFSYIRKAALLTERRMNVQEALALGCTCVDEHLRKLCDYIFIKKSVLYEIRNMCCSYNGLWYIAPIHSQKLILFVMQKGIKNITLTLGFILDASMQTFATVKLHFFKDKEWHTFNA